MNWWWCWYPKTLNVGEDVVIHSSDERYKDLITPIENQMKKLNY